MKRVSRKAARELRSEYDFASMKGGVRGKHLKRYRAGTNLVLLDPEVAEAFPSDAAVNAALRAVLDMTSVVPRKKRLPRSLQPTSRVRSSRPKPRRARVR